MIKESITLKDLNTFAKENGLNENTKIFVNTQDRLLAIKAVCTECPSKDALYTDIYLDIEQSNV